MKIILGSKSIGRKRVLTDAGYKFKIMVADMDEKAIRSNDYTQLPLLIARAKAKVLLERIHKPAILITSDQVVVCNGELREKPETELQAREYLRSYGTYPGQTNTAVVVTNTKTHKCAEGIDIATIYFNPIPNEIIEAVIKEGFIMNAAGGFMIENPMLSPYINHVEGSGDSIAGLPLKLTQKLIEEVE